MVKTTLYLPDDLKRSIEREAAERRVSEAEVIRSAITEAVKTFKRPKPQVGIIDADWEPVDWDNNDWLRGFGES